MLGPVVCPPTVLEVMDQCAPLGSRSLVDAMISWIRRLTFDDQTEAHLIVQVSRGTTGLLLEGPLLGPSLEEADHFRGREIGGCVRCLVLGPVVCLPTTHGPFASTIFC